jgi:hypothetical protein
MSDNTDYAALQRLSARRWENERTAAASTDSPRRSPRGWCDMGGSHPAAVVDSSEVERLRKHPARIYVATTVDVERLIGGP